MRRLWAYILLAFTSLVLVGVTFSSVMTQVDSNMDYQSSREMFFRIAEKESTDSSVQTKELTTEGLQTIADDFKNRLDNSNVSSYEVKIHGTDTISVSLSQNNNEGYSNIRTYLSCDGSFALASPVPGNYAEADEFLTDGEAYIETYQGIPCVILPVDVESEVYKTTYESVVKAQEDEQTEYSEETKSQDNNGEEVTTNDYYLYLYYNWNAEAYEQTGFEDSQNNTDNSLVNRYCMKFRIEDSADLQYFPDGENNKLFSAINLDINGDQQVSVSERETAYSRAKFFVNILNADSYDYQVKFMYENLVYGGAVESIFDFSDNKVLALNATLFATICCVVITGFLLAIYYRLGAVAVSSLTLLSVFAGLVSMIWLSAEYNALALIGLVLVGIASLASGAIYLAKIKDEAYRGRSLKKANNEAAKKSLLPIIDVNVAVIIVGVFAYIFGGSLMRSFAAVSVIGGIVSLVLNTLGLRGMMWLATNTTSLQGKYECFGINKENVPDILKEEKQNYYGAYADRDLTKKKKKVGIAALLVLVATTAGAITFGVINNGEIYSTPKQEEASLIYFEAHSDISEYSSPLLKEETIDTILENLYVYTDDKENATKLSTWVENIQIDLSYSQIDANEKTTTYYQSVVVLDRPVSEDINAYYVNPSDATDILEIYEDKTDINSILTGITEDSYDANNTISLKATKIVATNKLSIPNIALACGVAALVLALYMMIRYGLSRGLTLLIVNLVMTLFTITLFALLRIPVTTFVASVAPVVLAFTTMLSIFFASREKEMLADNHHKNLTLDDKKSIMVKATSSSFSTMLVVTVLAIYIAISFFGFGSAATAPTFGLLLISCLFAALLVSTLFGPTSIMFMKLFGRVHVRKPTKKKRSKVVRANKGAEPEEAVFIGIND